MIPESSIGAPANHGFVIASTGAVINRVNADTSDGPAGVESEIDRCISRGNCWLKECQETRNQHTQHEN